MTIFVDNRQGKLLNWFFFLVLWFDVYSLLIHPISSLKGARINAVYLPRQNKEELEIIYEAKLKDLI